MTFTLPPLPYDKNALSPMISATTMECHYEKHHRGYVDKLNKLIADTPMSQMTLEQLVAKAWNDDKLTSVFNNAAQVLNHNFFWSSMAPDGGERMLNSLRDRVDSDFGSFKKFESEFVEKAVAKFGSGWVWLVSDAGRLKIITTDDAVTPLVLGPLPVLACDIWEHAYYLDYKNDREKFVWEFLLRLANWDFAAARLTSNEGRAVSLAEAQR